MNDRTTCACSGAPTLIFPCSGGSDVGCLTDQAARKMTKDGTGTHHLPDSISAGALAWRAANQAEAASALKQPDAADQQTQHLQQPFQRGRLSTYVMGGPGQQPAPSVQPGGGPGATGRVPWRRPNQ